MENEKLSLNQCEEIAKSAGYDSMKFYLCGPKGKKKCKWLDAYFGIFEMDGIEGFMRSNEFMFVDDIWCELT